MAVSELLSFRRAAFQDADARNGFDEACAATSSQSVMLIVADTVMLSLVERAVEQSCVAGDHGSAPLTGWHRKRRMQRKARGTGHSRSRFPQTGVVRW